MILRMGQNKDLIIVALPSMLIKRGTQYMNYNNLPVGQPVYLFSLNILGKYSFGIHNAHVIRITHRILISSKI